MFKLLGGLSVYFKYQEIRTDNAVFRLHNVFTTVLLLTCSLIITATQYVGQPIQCIVGGGLPTHVVNTFCWITSTFTMPDAFAREVGSEVAHPGVMNEYDSSQEKKYYSYYQWVCFALFFQAIMCYTPKYLWDAFEGGLLKTIVMGLTSGACHAEEKDKKKKVIINYLRMYKKRHKMYAFRYWGCELLCLINIVLQMWMMDSFFNGEFFSYGIRVLGYSEIAQEDRYDPMIYVFPRVTKCTFHKFGPSGSIQTHDSLCILPLNIVNEKTYIFIWFWYIILAVILVLLVLYRLIIICLPSVRPRLLQARSDSISRKSAEIVSRELDIGDWWLMYMIARNMDPIIYKELIRDLIEDIGEKGSPSA
ncbi:innexin inx1 [Leptidea sinapis]|uniref:innexin inx1 n=1 Tax=Leptidea sinapis TaxID=189913 RepID=UPI0021C360B6|nr:innexin inx1 [Leptidea sinapis]